MRAVSGKIQLAIQQLIEQIFASGQMTRQDYLRLTSVLLSERRITDTDRAQINRIFDELQMGRLTFLD